MNEFIVNISSMSLLIVCNDDPLLFFSLFHIKKQQMIKDQQNRITHKSALDNNIYQVGGFIVDKKRPDLTIEAYYKKCSIGRYVIEILGQNLQIRNIGVFLIYKIKQNKLMEALTKFVIRPQTVDIEIETLFTMFDHGHKGHITRPEIAQILNYVFKDFNLSNPVTEEDVNNFLIDYDIFYQGDLTRKDFENVSKLRFILHQQDISKSRIVTKMSVARNDIPVQHIIVPVRMLFDLFNRSHDGHLTRDEVRQVINFIFRDFNLVYQVSEMDIQNFLLDFDMDHDHQITIKDFNGVQTLHFDIHHEYKLIQ